MGLARSVDGFLERLTRVEPSPNLIVVVPIIVACVRVAEECLVDPSLGRVDVMLGGTTFLFSHLFNCVLFYLMAQGLMAQALTLSSGRKSGDLFGPASVGLVLAWLPALLDLLFPAHSVKRYRFFFEWHWDLLAPYQSLGESLTLWTVILAGGLFVLWLTRSPWRGVLGLLLFYVVIQLLTWGWYEVSRALAKVMSGGDSMFVVYAMMNLIGIVMILGTWVLRRPRALLPSLERVNHALPWGLVTAISARLVAIDWPEALLRGAVMTLAFQLVIVANDYFDREQDGAAGGQARPAGREDAVLATYLQVLLGVWVLCFRPGGFHSVLLFFALFAAYHLPGLRLKRLFCGAYKIEGLAGAACVLFGASREAPSPWLPWLALLALGGFSLGSMFKDYKDIDQDRAAKVGTIYTRSLKAGRSLRGIHAVVCAVTSILLLVPPAWLVFSGRPWLPAVGLVALAALVGGLLFCLEDRRRAVESSFWALGAYLVVLMLQVPSL